MFVLTLLNNLKNIPIGLTYNSSGVLRVCSNDIIGYIECSVHEEPGTGKIGDVGLGRLSKVVKGLNGRPLCKVLVCLP